MAGKKKGGKKKKSGNAPKNAASTPATASVEAVVLEATVLGSEEFWKSAGR